MEVQNLSLCDGQPYAVVRKSGGKWWWYGYYQTWERAAEVALDLGNGSVIPVSEISNLPNVCDKPYNICYSTSRFASDVAYGEGYDTLEEAEKALSEILMNADILTHGGVLYYGRVIRLYYNDPQSFN